MGFRYVNLWEWSILSKDKFQRTSPILVIWKFPSPKVPYAGGGHSAQMSKNMCKVLRGAFKIEISRKLRAFLKTNRTALKTDFKPLFHHFLAFASEKMPNLGGFWASPGSKQPIFGCFGAQIPQKWHLYFLSLRKFLGPFSNFISVLATFHIGKQNIKRAFFDFLFCHPKISIFVPKMG